MSMVTIQECARVMEVGLDWSPDASVSNGFSPPLSPYTYKQGVWDFQRRLDTVLEHGTIVHSNGCKFIYVLMKQE